jgi:N-acetylmuramic acid 6-phosphate (MurNAc-6-P) etherase
MLRTFDAALAELAQSSPEVKRAIMTAITACIAAAGKMTLEESELLRAVAAVLGCPVPPIAATN